MNSRSFAVRVLPLLALLVPLAVLGVGPAAAQALPQGQGGAIGQDRHLGHTYVAQPASNVVFILQTATMAVQMVLKVPPSPAAIAVDDQRHRLYVAADTAGVISVFDGRTGRLLRTLAIGGHPAGLALTGGGTALLATDRVSGNVQRIPLLPTGDPQQVFAAGSADAPVLVLAPPILVAGKHGVAWARGFAPGERVVLYWGVQPLVRMTASALGIATAHFAVPRGVSLGRHLVIMMGQASTHSISTLLTVVRPPIVVKPKRYVPPPPSLLEKLLSPRLIVTVPAMAALGPLRKLAGPHPGLSAPALALEAGIALICAALVVRSGRGRRRRALERKAAKAATGKPRRPPASPAMTLKKAS